MARKDLLSEAIADAKAVKETALANAKLALEEAFTPKLQSMISAKLAEEMDDELPAIDLGSERTATMIAVGSNHSCALLDNATVKCWGRSNSGQLGYNDTATRGDGAGEMGNALPAISFAAGRTATAIAAGASHTCALLDNAQVVCWGDNAYGQLGQGNMDNIGDGIGPTVATTATIDLGTGRTAIAISAGDLHTCALLDNATVKCWGSAGNGRLGTGATNDRGDDPNEIEP